MSAVSGNTSGLRKTQISALERLARRRLGTESLCSYELAEALCELALDIGRDVGLLVDERGRITQISVGVEYNLDVLSDIQPPSRAGSVYSGYWVVASPGWQDSVPMAFQVSLLQYHLPVGVLLMAGTEKQFSRSQGENPTYCDAAMLIHPLLLEEDSENAQLVAQSDPLTVARKLETERFEDWYHWAEQRYAGQVSRRNNQREQAILIGLYDNRPGSDAPDSDTREDLLAELCQLAATAGADVLSVLTQSRTQPDSKTYLGRGKADELALLVQQMGANVVIADDELSPVQQRNLEAITRVKVIDRSELILDIFAQRARSREGKIQVQLAQFRYLLPRLIGRGKMFSQQTSVGAKGGIATRGPGETKLETDRRALQRQINHLEQEAKAVVRHRDTQRLQRQRQGMPVVALVGYTNAGKSTLMRKLTQADVLVEDKLFATLDPTTRRLYLQELSSEVLLSDTVGFIRKLPTTLIKAFRATLEETVQADLLLHVWDISHPDRLAQLESVQETLSGIGADNQPVLMVCNKVDQLPETTSLEAELESLAPFLLDEYVCISALQGEGIPVLCEKMAQRLAGFLNYG